MHARSNHFEIMQADMAVANVYCSVSNVNIGFHCSEEIWRKKTFQHD